MTDTADFLPDGTCLDRYRLEGRLGGGGFSIVYRATDLAERRRVAIKELFPAKYAWRDADGRVTAKSDRDGRLLNKARKLFFQEASILASLKHPNIVNITHLFSAKGTIYMVMDYEKGITLSRAMRRNGGRLDEQTIRQSVLPLLDGLRLLHDYHLLHLDIKPGNIYLREQGGPVLLDFGAVHKILSLDEMVSIPVVSPGYSPPEQIQRDAVVGPWTDIYAFGATLRACIQGKPPPAARERLKNDPLESAVKAFRGRYSRQLLAAIDWAMSVDPEHRPRSVDAFAAALQPGGERPSRPPKGLLARVNAFIRGRSGSN